MISPFGRAQARCSEESRQEEEEEEEQEDVDEEEEGVFLQLEDVTMSVAWHCAICEFLLHIIDNVVAFCFIEFDFFFYKFNQF